MVSSCTAPASWCMPPFMTTRLPAWRCSARTRSRWCATASSRPTAPMGCTRRARPVECFAIMMCGATPPGTTGARPSWGPARSGSIRAMSPRRIPGRAPIRPSRAGPVMGATWGPSRQSRRLARRPGLPARPRPPASPPSWPEPASGAGRCSPRWGASPGPGSSTRSPWSRVPTSSPPRSTRRSCASPWLRWLAVAPRPCPHLCPCPHPSPYRDGRRRPSSDRR